MKKAQRLHRRHPTASAAVLAANGWQGVERRWSVPRSVDELNHDLQVHQIELEMQNEALRCTQLTLEAMRDRYLDLYDRAPVGYFSISEHGLIAEANLTGAALLGVDRKRLLNSRFTRHLAPFDTDRWHRYVVALMRDGGEQHRIDVCMQTEERGMFHAQIDGVRGTLPGAAPCLHVTLIDISERRAREDEIAQLAFFDPLTDLPNRRLMKDRLQQALSAGTRSQHEGALMFIDLDHFKEINDTLGHDKGDALLQQAAARLTSCVREGDTVARLGGDEFVVMLPPGLSESREQSVAQARAIGEKILAALRSPYLIDGLQLHLSASVGITLFGEQPGASVDDLLKRADQAMYQAKAAGRDTLRFFDPVVHGAARARSQQETELREAIVRHQMVLHYQPVVDGEERVIGAEALMRWQHAQRGLLLPAEFIGLAEETGLILPLGQWALETACAQLGRWADDPALAALELSVNVCSLQLAAPDFVAQVLALVRHHRFKPARLKLELTESVLLQDVDDAIAKMRELKAFGVGFSLDDFGTGYSSLAYLKRLPLDQLKIDRSFVHDMVSKPRDASIVRTIAELGHNLGLRVVAEGVISQAQHSALVEMGCEGFQGELLGMPMDVQSFEALARTAPTAASENLQPH